MSTRVSIWLCKGDKDIASTMLLFLHLQPQEPATLLPKTPAMPRSQPAAQGASPTSAPFPALHEVQVTHVLLPSPMPPPLLAHPAFHAISSHVSPCGHLSRASSCFALQYLKPWQDFELTLPCP